jgi:hypothetical protein
MKPTEKAEFIVAMCRPSKTRRKSSLQGMYGLGLGDSQHNKQKTIYGRTSDAYRALQGDIHFLAGVMNVLPALNLKRGSQFSHEAEKLVNKSYSFAINAVPSAASIRKMRKFGEKMCVLLDKIDKDLKAK